MSLWYNDGDDDDDDGEDYFWKMQQDADRESEADAEAEYLEAMMEQRRELHDAYILKSNFELIQLSLPGKHGPTISTSVALEILKSRAEEPKK
jgi:hypothetical protein